MDNIRRFIAEALVTIAQRIRPFESVSDMIFISHIDQIWDDIVRDKL